MQTENCTYTKLNCLKFLSKWLDTVLNNPLKKLAEENVLMWSTWLWFWMSCLLRRRWTLPLISLVHIVWVVNRNVLSQLGTLWRSFLVSRNTFLIILGLGPNFVQTLHMLRSSMIILVNHLSYQLDVYFSSACWSPTGAYIDFHPVAPILGHSKILVNLLKYFKSLWRSFCRANQKKKWSLFDARFFGLVLWLIKHCIFVTYWSSTQPSIGKQVHPVEDITLTCGRVEFGADATLTGSRWTTNNYITRCHRQFELVGVSCSWKNHLPAEGLGPSVTLGWAAQQNEKEVLL